MPLLLVPLVEVPAPTPVDGVPVAPPLPDPLDFEVPQALATPTARREREATVAVPSRPILARCMIHLVRV
jgi:hypothetical protein